MGAAGKLQRNFPPRQSLNTYIYPERSLSPVNGVPRQQDIMDLVPDEARDILETDSVEETVPRRGNWGVVRCGGPSVFGFEFSLRSHVPRCKSADSRI